MEWFKHDTDSVNNEDISDAEDLFGDAGYSVFFKMLEIYGRKFNKTNDEGFLSISLTFVRRKLRKSSTKAQQILNFYQKRKRFVWKADPTDSSKILFKVVDFIERSSNWTKRQYKTPTEAPTEAPLKKRHTEEETKKKKEKDIKKHIEYPDWLDVSLWKEFKKYRTKIKAPLTTHAEKLCFTNLKKVIDEGHIQADVINQTIMSGKWKGFYPIHSKEGSQQLKPTTYAQAQDAERRQLARSVLEDMKDAEKNNGSGTKEISDILSTG